MLDTFTWYKQSTFRWKGEKLVVYIDSWGLTDGLPPADLLLITHAHGDHYAPDDIARVQAKKTVIVAPADVAKELSSLQRRSGAPGGPPEAEQLGGLRPAARREHLLPRRRH